MTQTPFAPVPVLMPETTDDPGTGGSRRTLLVAGGLAAALVLGAGGYFLLGGGGSSGDTSSAPLPPLPKPKSLTTKVVAPGQGGAKVAAKPVAKVPATSSVPIGRDPFHALYVQSVAPPADPNASGAGGGAPAGGTSPSSGTSSTTPLQTVSYALTLAKVTGGTNGSAAIFTWDVAGTSKTVIAAQKFGKYGELVTLTWVKSSTGKPIGAVVQVGDDEPIAVKVGEKIIVK